MDDERLIEEGLAGRLQADTPEFERFVEITARRPSGAVGAAHYRDPKEHEESFALAIAALGPAQQDRYLELCVGGGQLLERILAVVTGAAGIDHSPDMVELTRERNAAAVEAGRLELVEGDVHELPWENGAFTCAACVNAFFFVERPEIFLREVRRVLGPGGRFVLYTAGPGAASSGSWAPALRTYEADSLRDLFLAAGFDEAKVEERDGHQLVVARIAPSG